MKTTTTVAGLEAAAKAVSEELGIPVEAVRVLMRLDMQRLGYAVGQMLREAEAK